MDVTDESYQKVIIRLSAQIFINWVIYSLIVLCLFCSVFKQWYAYVIKQPHNTENFIVTALMVKKFPSLMQQERKLSCPPKSVVW